MDRCTSISDGVTIERAIELLPVMGPLVRLQCDALRFELQALKALNLWKAWASELSTTPYYERVAEYSRYDTTA